MGHSALFQVSSVKSLIAAWQGILRRSTPRSRLSSGIDNQRLVDFDQNFVGNCRQLSDELRDPGGYQFSALRPHFIPKIGGKTRVICVPTVRDRVVQRAVNDFLSAGDRCKLSNGVSFGFIPGRSVELAARKACRLRESAPWAYKTDITSFFDAIDRRVLADAIGRGVKDRSLHALLLAAASSEIHTVIRTQDEKLRRLGIHTGRGVRQGMPLSPFFANLVLRRFDRTIEAAGIRMVRYADDLICLADSRATCESIHERVKGALALEGLSIPDPGAAKTCVYEPDEPAEFLGLSLRRESGSYVLEVSAEQTAKVRQKIADLADVSQLSAAGLGLGDFFRRLDGSVAGYSGAYSFANNAAHLEKALDSARRSAVERLFERELGLNVGALSAEKRRFIGLEA